ncbi:MAG: TetR/AcrR family transcriptional regulator [Dehalobacter sp.]|nr:TetR/AcrR family transcriptional regulator [Dehalobacter sp.]
MNEKSFERKTEVLEAALNEFTAKSYQDASLNTIIKNAGISKGTFYYHFEDKQALYLYLLESSVKTKWEFINDKIYHNPELNAGGNIFDNFKLQARLAAEFAAMQPQYHKLSRMFSREQGNPIYIAAKDLLGGDTEEILAALIDKAIEAGSLKKEYSRDFLVKILSYLFLHFDEIFDRDEDSDLDRMLSNLDSYVDFIQYGMSGNNIKHSCNE